MRLNQCDPGFKYEVAAEPGGEGLKKCFSCGACSASCQVAGHLPAYDPRRLIRQTLLGMREEVLASPLIWRCSSCHSCAEACPQQVRFVEVLTAIKNIAAREGHAPPAAAAAGKLLARQGRLLEVGEFENQKRAKMGLPPVSSHPGRYQRILGLDPRRGQEDEE